VPKSRDQGSGIRGQSMPTPPVISVVRQYGVIFCKPLCRGTGLFGFAQGGLSRQTAFAAQRAIDRSILQRLGRPGFDSGRNPSTHS